MGSPPSPMYQSRSAGWWFLGPAKWFQQTSYSLHGTLRLRITKHCLCCLTPPFHLVGPICTSTEYTPSFVASSASSTRPVCANGCGLSGSGGTFSTHHRSDLIRPVQRSTNDFFGTSSLSQVEMTIRNVWHHQKVLALQRLKRIRRVLTMTIIAIWMILGTQEYQRDPDVLMVQN